MTPIATGARRWLRAVRHSPDRLSHSLRRRALLSRLRREPVPSSILVLCHGNICRSPYAAGRLAQSLRDSCKTILVLSAGFHEAGRCPPDEALSVAFSRGIDMTSHRSRMVTADLLQGVDVVIVMNVAQARKLKDQFGRQERVILLGDLDPRPILTRTIRDPIDQPADVFSDVYERIDRCLDNLTRQWRPGRIPA
jgi:protein-tyrosine-phosphatase